MLKKTKIVCTIGPASDKKETLKKMIKSGMNICRINFSHGTHESNGKVIDIVRNLGNDLATSVGIMADLQGPRIRTLVEEDLNIENGECIWVSDSSQDFNFQFPISNLPRRQAGFQKNSNYQIPSKKLFLDSAGIVEDIEVGNEILIEDGLKRIKVVEKGENYLLAEVINGGVIKNHKGVNIPDAKLKIPAVTEKDEKDLKFAMQKEVDFVALSFVSTAQDIQGTRDKMKKMLGREDNLPHIVSKIERKEAIKNIDELIDASDVIMVARGDLGIELPETKVVLYQKEIISKCLKKGKPVIVATQMLNSMIDNPLPTRAEVSDVSNAVIDHTDAVMLSGESANGQYPVESVATMSQIVSDTEESRFDNYVPHHIDIEDHMCSDYAPIIASAWKLAKTSDAKAIIAISRSGFTARMLSNFRPSQKLLVATNSEKTYNQLSMVWGVESYLFNQGEDLESFIDLTIEKAKKDKKLESGDKIVVVMGRIPGGDKMRMIGIREIN